jgi:hypothetical protein
LWARYWTFGFYKCSEISWLAEELLDSQEALCSVECILYSMRMMFNWLPNTAFLKQKWRVVLDTTQIVTCNRRECRGSVLSNHKANLKVAGSSPCINISCLPHFLQDNATAQFESIYNHSILHCFSFVIK